MTNRHTRNPPAPTRPSTGSDPTAPPLVVPPRPAIRDDRPPGPSHGPPAGGGLPPAADWPPGPNSSAPSAAQRRWRRRIGLMAVAAAAALCAGTVAGHVLWPASAPTISPAGSSSHIGAGSSGGAKGQSPSGSGSSPIPTKQYPGATGGLSGGSSHSLSGSGISMNPNSQYPDGSSG